METIGHNKNNMGYKGSLKKRLIGKIFLATLFLLGCIDSYTPPSTIQNYGYLVVDGVLNTGGDTIQFALSHTQPVSSTDSPVPETGAIVSIQEENGSSYNMISDGAGNYTLSPGLLNLTKNLRMHIVASDGKEYVSPYVTPLITPPIDSISLPRDNSGKIKTTTLNGVDGVDILVNTHDPLNKSKFFLWKYEETWQYDAGLASTLIQDKVKDTVVARSLDQLINTCYITVPSTNIQVYSTTDLNQDIVSEFSIMHIPISSPKLSIRYSVLVHQYALTVDAYEYWLNIQKNTENLGSIFGSLPVQVTGNFTCVTDPSIPVLGFFSATAEQDKRIFITDQQLPLHRWNDPFYDACSPDTINVAASKVPSVELFLSPVYKRLLLVGYTIGPASCADCRLHGGGLKPPPFW